MKLSSNARAKTQRAYQEVELYSQKYYDDRVQPLVEAEIKSRELKTSREVLDCIKRHTRQVWENETDEVKEEIALLAEESKEAAKREREYNQDEDRERSPSEYQRYVLCFLY